MENGDFVKVDYVGKLESGEIFDLTLEDVAKKEKIYNEKIKYKPVTIVIGSGFVISGLDNAIKGMKVGDKKIIEIEPKDGFGERNPDMVRTISDKEIKSQVNPKPNMIIDFGGLKGRIVSMSSGRVTIDFNNPMAGKKLTYDIELKEKIEKSDEKVKSLFDFFGFNPPDVKMGEELEIVAMDIPKQIKEKISEVIIKNIKSDEKEIKKVKFIEIFDKANSSKQ